MSKPDAKGKTRYFSDLEMENKSTSGPPCSDDDDDNLGAPRRCGGCRLPPWRALVTVAACTLVLATLGLSYMRGNMMPYATSYLRNVTGDTSLDYTRMLWLGNSGWLAFSGSVPFFGLLQKRMSNHQRLYILMGISIHAGSHLGSYWGVQKSLGLVIAFNGVMAGFAQAMAYPACLAVSLQWFPRHRGVVGGITMSGFGVGAFVWNQVITMWINPDNLQPDLVDGENRYFTQPEVLDRVPACYLILGGILTFVQLVCLASLTFPPPVVTARRCSSEKKPRVDGAETGVTGKAILSRDYEKSPNEAEKTLEDVTGEESTQSRLTGERNLNSHELKWDDVSLEEKAESRDAADKCQGQGEAKLAEVSVEVGKGRACSAEICLQSAPFEKDTNDKGLPDGEASRNTERPEYSPLQVLKSPVTYMLFVNALTVDLAFIFIVSFYKTYGQTFIHNDHLLSLVGSFASVFNAAGRPVWGLVADRIGFLPALLVTETVLVVASATFVASELVGSSAMFFIWVCVMYESMGGVYALQGPTVSSLYGFNYFVFNFGLITSTGLVSCFASVELTGFLLPLFGWRSLYYAAAVSVAFGMLVTVPILIKCGQRTCIPRHLRARVLAMPRRRR